MLVDYKVAHKILEINGGYTNDDFYYPECENPLPTNSKFTLSLDTINNLKDTLKNIQVSV